MIAPKTLTGGLALALVVATALTAADAQAAPPDPAPQARTADPGTPVPGARTAARPTGRTDPSASTLRRLGDRADLKIGAAIGMDALAEDAQYRRLAATQFSSVTAENVMKWEVLQPRRGEFDFRQADALVRFARENKQVVRGHTLVWHSQLPAWVNEGGFTATELRREMRRHIKTVMTRYRGDIVEWDVVNEAFNEDGTLRDSIWLRTLGPGYIAEAFRYAHRIDPKAKLFYNDYNIEGINAKSDAAYRLIRELRADGVPVQGIGLQSHLDIQYPYPPDLLKNMQRFAALKMDVSVTEADVRMDLPVDPTKAQAQAGAYDALLSSCLLVKRCRNFTVWGISDAYSWIPGVFEGQGSALLWDEEYATKPAYDQLRRTLALAGGTPR